MSLIQAPTVTAKEISASKLGRLAEKLRAESQDQLALECLRLGMLSRACRLIAEQPNQMRNLEICGRVALLFGKPQMAVSVAIVWLNKIESRGWILPNEHRVFEPLIKRIDEQSYARLCKVSANFISRSFRFLDRFLSSGGSAPKSRMHSAETRIEELNRASKCSDRKKILNSIFALFEMSPVNGLDQESEVFIGQLDGLNVDGTDRGDQDELLSIVVSGFNVERYISLALRSILAQTYRNLELIYVDDASTDRTAELARAIANEDSRVSVIALDKNIGNYAAKNVGLRAASGAYVALHDADDWSHPEKYAASIRQLKKNERLVLVSSCYYRILDEGEIARQKGQPWLRWSPNSIVFIREKVLKRCGYLAEDEFGCDSEFVARLICTFGERSHRKLYRPYTLAALRKNSLTTSSATGMDDSGYSRRRVDFEDFWREWHLYSLSQGCAPYLNQGNRLRDIFVSPFSPPSSLDLPLPYKLGEEI